MHLGLSCFKFFLKITAWTDGSAPNFFQDLRLNT